MNPEQNTQPRDESAKKGSRRWTLLMLGCGLVVVYFAALSPTKALDGWFEDYDAALAEAASSDRIVLLDFFGDYCPPCVMMERYVFGKPIVREALAGFVAVRVNASEQVDIFRRYGVSEMPTFIVTDASGTQIARAEGYHDKEDFAAFLTQAAELSRLAAGS